MTHTSTVIVALPAKDSPVHEFGAETKHATLVFLGDVTDPTPAHDAARAMAEKWEPFSAEVEKHGKLGSNNPPAHVLFLGKSDLSALHDQLLDHSPELRDQYNAIEQYPDYVPHMTIGYPGEGEDADDTPDDDPEEAYANVPEVVFDRIGVWHKGEQTEYPLAPDTLSGLVAGYRFVRTQQGAKRFGVPIGSQIQVDSQGRVVRINSAKQQGTTAPVVAPSFAKVDPNRTPTKFVATVPGQVAKIPPGSRLATSFRPKQAPAPSQSRPKNANPSINPAMRGALTNQAALEQYHVMTSRELAAMAALRQNKALSAGDKAALRGMIAAVLKTMAANAPKSKQSSSSKPAAGKSKTKAPQTAAQKAATQKAQKASSTSTSSAKKSAQAKSQAAATQASALARTLRAAFKALGGNPGKLPQMPGSSSGPAAKSPSHQAGFMSSTAGKKQSSKVQKLFNEGFTSLSSKDLTSAIQSLAGMSRSNPSSQVLSALHRAKVEKRRRELLQRQSAAAAAQAAQSGVVR